MTEAAHSILGASSMYRWSVCPGSVKLCKDVPQITSKYAEEGTFAHEMAARFVVSDLPADEFWRLNEEMREAIKVYNDTICADRELDFSGAKLFVERRFDLSVVYPGCFGTTDAALWLPKLKLLIVYDFKYGSGMFVEVEDNDQFLYYALGALLELGFPAVEVEVVVVQPRCVRKKSGPVRRHRFPAIQILDFMDKLVEAAKRTEAPDAPLVTGRHCYFCAAKDLCPARHKQRLEDAISEFGEIVEDVDPFS